MKAKLITAGLFFALAGVASASEPVVLSESQMDSVTAGMILMKIDGLDGAANELQKAFTSHPPNTPGGITVFSSEAATMAHPGQVTKE